MELLECMVMFNKNIQIDHVILYPHQKKYEFCLFVTSFPTPTVSLSDYGRPTGYGIGCHVLISLLQMMLSTVLCANHSLTHIPSWMRCRPNIVSIFCWVA